MWCICAYEYVVSEAKMTKIFAIYLQASDLQNQSSEYAFECYREQLGDMVSPCLTPLLMLIFLLSLCRWTVIEL